MPNVQSRHRRVSLPVCCSRSPLTKDLLCRLVEEEGEETKHSAPETAAATSMQIEGCVVPPRRPFASRLTALAARREETKHASYDSDATITSESEGEKI